MLGETGTQLPLWRQPSGRRRCNWGPGRDPYGGPSDAVFVSDAVASQEQPRGTRPLRSRPAENIGGAAAGAIDLNPPRRLPSLKYLRSNPETTSGRLEVNRVGTGSPVTRPPRQGLFLACSAGSSLGPRFCFPGPPWARRSALRASAFRARAPACFRRSPRFVLGFLGAPSFLGVRPFRVPPCFGPRAPVGRRRLGSRRGPSSAPARGPPLGPWPRAHAGPRRWLARPLRGRPSGPSWASASGPALTPSGFRYVGPLLSLQARRARTLFHAASRRRDFGRAAPPAISLRRSSWAFEWSRRRTRSARLGRAFGRASGGRPWSRRSLGLRKAPTADRSARRGRDFGRAARPQTSVAPLAGASGRPPRELVRACCSSPATSRGELRVPQCPAAVSAAPGPRTPSWTLGRPRRSGAVRNTVVLSLSAARLQSRRSAATSVAPFPGPRGAPAADLVRAPRPRLVSRRSAADSGRAVPWGLRVAPAADLVRSPRPRPRSRRAVADFGRAALQGGRREAPVRTGSAPGLGSPATPPGNLEFLSGQRPFFSELWFRNPYSSKPDSLAELS